MPVVLVFWQFVEFSLLWCFLAVCGFVQGRGQMLFHTEAGTRLGYVSLEDRGWSREALGLAKGGETFGSGTSPVPLP